MTSLVAGDGDITVLYRAEGCVVDTRRQGCPVQAKEMLVMNSCSVSGCWARLFPELTLSLGLHLVDDLYRVCWSCGETGGSGRIRMQGGSWDMVGSWRESAQSNGMEVDEAVDDLMRSGEGSQRCVRVLKDEIWVLATLTKPPAISGHTAA